MPFKSFFMEPKHKLAMKPDQAAPKGTVLSGPILFAI